MTARPARLRGRSAARSIRKSWLHTALKASSLGQINNIRQRIHLNQAYEKYENELKKIVRTTHLEEGNKAIDALKHDVEEMKQALPPLLLIPLVENAFKHGAAETRGEPIIDIHLSVNNRQLAFYVKNSTGEVNDLKSVKENIGLSNLRRQLELLYSDYNLSLQQDEFIFTATLKINLASHV